MKRLAVAVLVATVASSGAQADGFELAGTLWACTRARDGTQFVIMFYTGGGVGGGESDKGEVNPYVFDASRVGKDRWPGRWSQNGQRFTWKFPDQHMVIEGSVDPGGREERLIGTEDALGLKSAITCRIQREPPTIGEGLVIPQDGHFIDRNDREGRLKVPAGISLQPPGKAP